MNKEIMIALARKSEGEEQQHGMWRMHVEDLERFAVLVAAHERNKMAAWMIARGYATGHGDTTEDLLTELEWQIKEREREECASVALTGTGEAVQLKTLEIIRAERERIADAIRNRSN